MASFLQFRDIPSYSWKTLMPEAPENQDPGESQSQSSHNQASDKPENQDFSHMQHSPGPRPLSPQLLLSLAKKPLRTIRRYPRNLSPPATPSLPAIAGSIVVVPSKWCNDNRLGNLRTYISRDSLLSKVYKRRDLYRTYHICVAEVNLSADMEFLGTPVDYFLIFPLKPLSKQEGLPLKGITLNKNQVTTHVWAIGPTLTNRNSLNQHPGTGLLSIDGRPFPWVINSTGTKLCSPADYASHGIEKITGFVECPKCKKLWGISYGLHRFQTSTIYIKQVRENKSSCEKKLQQSHFNCRCDGNNNPVKPFISENFNNINWLFLLLGFGLGFCTNDQLKFYCNNKRGEMQIFSEDRNQLLLEVFADLLTQLIVI